MPRRLLHPALPPHVGAISCQDSLFSVGAVFNLSDRHVVSPHSPSRASEPCALQLSKHAARLINPCGGKLLRQIGERSWGRGDAAFCVLLDDGLGVPGSVGAIGEHESILMRTNTKIVTS